MLIVSMPIIMPSIRLRSPGSRMKWVMTRHQLIFTPELTYDAEAVVVLDCSCPGYLMSVATFRRPPSSDDQMCGRNHCQYRDGQAVNCGSRSPCDGPNSITVASNSTHPMLDLFPHSSQRPFRESRLSSSYVVVLHWRGSPKQRAAAHRYVSSHAPALPTRLPFVVVDSLGYATLAS